MSKPIAALHDVTGPEFRDYFRNDHTLDLETAFSQLDLRTFEVAKMIHFARQTLMDPGDYDREAVAATLTGCLAALAMIVEPFDQIYRATGNLRARDAGRAAQSEGQ